MIANKDSKINSLEDVLKCDKSLTFSNGDTNSTSGFVIPGYYVWGLNGKTPEDCFSRVVNSHPEGNAMAVASGKIDVATNNTESIYARTAEPNPEPAARQKALRRPPP